MRDLLLFDAPRIAPARKATRPPRRRGERPLYLMVKPPADAAAGLWRLPRVQASRGAELLHVTILALPDLASAPGGLLAALLDAMADFHAAPFALAFDRVRERRCVTLRADARSAAAALRLQAALADHLVAHGLPRFAGPREPHLTIAYRRDDLGDASLAPVGWQVEEVLLVESVIGQARHVVHGRWPLARAQR